MKWGMILFLGNKTSIIITLCFFVLIETVFGCLRAKKQKELVYLQKKEKQIELYMKDENELEKMMFKKNDY